TLAAASIKLGLTQCLKMGSLAAKRDWGYAGDHVEAMWRMLQAEVPDDYVIGTGILHSVEDLVRLAFACVDLDWQQHVESDPDLFRPDEHFQLVADPSKAKQNLHWQPAISFEALVEKMVIQDMERLRAGTAQPVGI
ncbi:MAG: GDP-mannose 4,6-dehydratase, partial [Cyanobacteria bacterium P01_A01_bin.105]